MEGEDGLRVGLKRSGEKEDLKATGERAVEGAIGGGGGGEMGGGGGAAAVEEEGGRKRLDFWDRGYR